MRGKHWNTQFFVVLVCLTGSCLITTTGCRGCEQAVDPAVPNQFVIFWKKRPRQPLPNHFAISGAESGVFKLVADFPDEVGGLSVVEAKRRARPGELSVADTLDSSQYQIDVMFPNYVFELPDRFDGMMPAPSVFDACTCNEQRDWWSDVRLAEAWTAAQPDGGAIDCRTVTVAVVDTGVAEQPGLEGNLARDCDFLALDGGTRPDDTDGHGTMVAGIVAARSGTFGGRSSSGVCPLARVARIKIFRERFAEPSKATFDAVARGMDRAARLGGRVVINASFAISCVTDACFDDHTRDGGICDRIIPRSETVLVVIAAGNAKQVSRMTFPAACPGARQITVSGECKAEPSYGVNPLGQPIAHIAGPADKACSTWLYTKCASFGGSSQAAAITSGVAALRWSQCPASSAESVRERLISGDSVPELGNVPRLNAKTVVGSSRVDLQACKLEYSIVSPK